MNKLEQDVIDAAGASAPDCPQAQRDDTFEAALGAIAILKSNLSGEPLERALLMLRDSYIWPGHS
ncbi:hypothetical protein [Pseudomonas fluorescens]|uniref:Uncharacterized protein n=1 Tax=Pseudomonas fluorescens TaxID=294 RepID=A0A5E7G074_PSEFL|nr:hypothetical protein [Pseudomonas fluorescens]VVO44955.1 hypothetical protein PS723_06475 [Pseudomonas fluorescens]